MLIAVSGKIGSGKSTLAELIQSSLKKHYPDKQVIIHGFSTELKKFVGRKYNIKPEMFEQQSFKNQKAPGGHETWGEILVRVGMEKRSINEDFWVNRLMKIYDANPEVIMVVPDLRFRNEAFACADRSGYLIRIDGDPKDIRKNTKRDIYHQSETDLDMYTGWDIFVPNNGSVNELKFQADLIASEIWQQKS